MRAGVLFPYNSCFCSLLCLDQPLYVCRGEELRRMEEGGEGGGLDGRMDGRMAGWSVSRTHGQVVWWYADTYNSVSASSWYAAAITRYGHWCRSCRRDATSELREVHTRVIERNYFHASIRGALVRLYGMRSFAVLRIRFSISTTLLCLSIFLPYVCLLFMRCVYKKIWIVSFYLLEVDIQETEAVFSSFLPILVIVCSVLVTIFSICTWATIDKTRIMKLQRKTFPRRHEEIK